MDKYTKLFENLGVEFKELVNKDEQTFKIAVQALENEYIICTEHDETEISNEPYKNYKPFAIDVLNNFISKSDVEFIDYLNYLYGSDYIEDIFESDTRTLDEIYSAVLNFK